MSAILLNLTHGSDTMYILGRSLSGGGRKAGVLLALGISTGCVVHTLLAALGLSVILSRSAPAFDFVKYLSAGYLIYLGIRSPVSRSSLLVLKQGEDTVSYRKIDALSKKPKACLVVEFSPFLIFPSNFNMDKI